MKKGCLIAVVAVVVIVLGCFVWVKNTYNGFVSQQEGVDAAWSQVENVYQRRADLIPNLVATVKGYAKHEQETLDKVVSARAKATQITVDPENLNEASLKKYRHLTYKQQLLTHQSNFYTSNQKYLLRQYKESL